MTCGERTAVMALLFRSLSNIVDIILSVQFITLLTGNVGFWKNDWCGLPGEDGGGRLSEKPFGAPHLSRH